MVDFKFFVVLSIAVLINFSTLVFAVNCPEPRVLKNLISINGFKKIDLLHILLVLGTCEKLGEDGKLTSDLMVYGHFVDFNGRLGHLTNRRKASNFKSIDVLLSVSVTVSTQIPDTTNSYTEIWTDTHKIELNMDHYEPEQSELPFEKVKEILRDAFHNDPEFEMTLYDLSGQKRTLEDYRQGNVSDLYEDAV